MPIVSNKRNYKRKRRINAHVIEDMSVNHFERFVFKKKYIVDCSLHDYGYDMSIETFNRKGEYEPGQIKVQMKAKKRPSYIKSKTILSFSCDRRDLNLWLIEPNPVILVVYDAKKEKSFWVYVQNYLRAIPKGYNHKKTKGTFNIHIPIKNKVNEKAIEKFRGFKTKNLNQAKKVITYEA
jgi:hypothetical protein